MLMMAMITVQMFHSAHTSDLQVETDFNGINLVLGN